MRIIALLMNLPNTSLFIGTGRQFEFWLGNQINHLVIRQEIAGVEIDPTRALPDDDLPYRKPFQDIGSILDETILNSPFVVVKDGTVFSDNTHHLSQTRSLPANVLGMIHAVVITFITIEQRSFRPLPLRATLQAITCTILDIIWWRCNNHLHRTVIHSTHDIQTIPSIKHPVRELLGFRSKTLSRSSGTRGSCTNDAWHGIPLFSDIVSYPILTAPSHGVCPINCYFLFGEPFQYNRQSPRIGSIHHQKISDLHRIFGNHPHRYHRLNFVDFSIHS